MREHPGRVLGIYIRNVSRDPERHRAIEALALEVVEAGSSLVLAADSLAMAEHAAAHGLIVPTALAEVARERVAEPGAPGPSPTVQIERASPMETRRMVRSGELEKALDQESGAALPQNVVIEAEEQPSEPRVRQGG